MQKIKITLEKLPEDVTLDIDLLRVQQVVINLLSNALKFSKANDIIDVRLKMTGSRFSDEVQLVIEISDKGIGISEEEQLLIFKPFYKA
jgi:two-component system, NarL family, sensor histidine kinase EvgS